MTNPSPAQTVLNAYAETVAEWFYDPARDGPDAHCHARALAAAIRAAAKQSTFADISVYKSIEVVPVDILFAIADELEGH